MLVRACNAHGGSEGAKTLKREGQQWGGREAYLSWGTHEERELREALAQAAPDRGLWTAAKVAAWLSEHRGRVVHMVTGWRTLQQFRHSVQVPRPRHPEVAGSEEQAALKTLETLATLRQEQPEKRVWLCLQDEARFGLKPSNHRAWAPISQRPIAPSHTRYEWSYVTASVHPKSGNTHTLILPSANLTTTQLVWA